MVSVKELRDWLRSLEDDDRVGVDDLGVALRVEGRIGVEAYFEIGGMPDDSDEDGRA